ncbi:unnamed protein product [marine sediment metagenome]|uniref:Uncharacterized protein n=1 Tax=marine sediment metagenome TaxID=412755 RepID=X0T9U0_9ZZZZ
MKDPKDFLPVLEDMTTKVRAMCEHNALKANIEWVKGAENIITQADATIDHLKAENERLIQIKATHVISPSLWSINAKLQAELKKVREERESLQKAHNYNIDKIWKLETKNARLKAIVDRVDVGEMANHLYGNQPACLSAIAKERRAEACFDIAQAIHDHIKEGK